MERTGQEGVLFVCTGAKYIKAAIRAAKTVRATNPGLPIAFYSNAVALGFGLDKDPYPFDLYEEIQNPHRRSKVDHLAKTPFARTLYLDSDTAVVEDIRPLFGVLDRFDLGICHAMKRNHGLRLLKWRLDIPRAFPQYNSGVILYRSTPKVLAFFEEWGNVFHTAGFSQDQHTLRELLWLSDLRLAVLPPEYNVRYEKYAWLWSKQEATPKIYHLQKYHDFMPAIYLKNFLRGILRFFKGLGLDLKPKGK